MVQPPSGRPRGAPFAADGIHPMAAWGCINRCGQYQSIVMSETRRMSASNSPMARARQGSLPGIGNSDPSQPFRMTMWVAFQCPPRNPTTATAPCPSPITIYSLRTTQSHITQPHIPHSQITNPVLPGLIGGWRALLAKTCAFLSNPHVGQVLCFELFRQMTGFVVRK